MLTVVTSATHFPASGACVFPEAESRDGTEQAGLALTLWMCSLRNRLGADLAKNTTQYPVVCCSVFLSSIGFILFKNECLLVLNSDFLVICDINNFVGVGVLL